MPVNNSTAQAVLCSWVDVYGVNINSVLTELGTRAWRGPDSSGFFGTAWTALEGFLFLVFFFFFLEL